MIAFLKFMSVIFFCNIERQSTTCGFYRIFSIIIDEVSFRKSGFVINYDLARYILAPVVTRRKYHKQNCYY